MVIPKINSAHGSDTRNIINRAIDLINTQGKSIQDLVAEGQLTPTQYTQLIQSINSLVAKGEIKLEDIDKNNFKLDQTFLSESLLEQMSGNAPINAVPAAESLVNEHYARKSITSEKTDFISTGKNLFDKEKVNLNKSLETTGQLLDNVSYDTSDYIDISAGTTYTRSHTNIMAFYNIKKELIGITHGTNPSDSPETFTKPSGAKFVRISMLKNYTDTFQLESGSSSTSYEPYKLISKKLELNNNNLPEEIVRNSGIVPSIKEKLDGVAEIQGVYTNEDSTGNVGESRYNSSTFSGWGSPVGVRKNFDSVSFYVYAFDNSMPITQVRVVVKENDYNGSVLNSGTFDVSAESQETSKLTVQFPEIIKNSTETPLWVEFHTNGRTGAFISSESFIPPGYPLSRYSTNSSLSNSDMKEVSDSKSSLYFEFKTQIGTKVVATQEFSESLSPSVASMKSDTYGKFLLRNWQSQAAKYINPDFNERLELMVIGDSWVQGKNGLTEPLRNKLKKEYGDGGIGFIGFANSHYGNGSVTVNLTGTWTEIDAHTGATLSKGIDVAHAESSTVGSIATVTIAESSNYFRIEHLKQTGSYRYNIDDGSWNTVDTSISNSEVISGLSDNSHTIKIEVLSGKVTLTGAYSYKSSKGVVVHKVGNGGMTTAQLLQSDKSNYVAQLKKSNAHTVGILLGTNDMAQNVSLSGFKNQIKEIIIRVKTALPLSDVFLIAPSDNDLVDRSHTMKEYSDALSEVALEENVAFISLYENIGNYEDANQRGLYANGTHPNANGGYVIANVIYDRLLRV